MSTRADYAKARDLAIEADAKGLPSEHLWAQARELKPNLGVCDCPKKPNGRLDTPRGRHQNGCPEKGRKRSGPSGKMSKEAIERGRAKQVTLAIGGGAKALDDAVALAGYASRAAFVEAAIAHLCAGGKFIS